jgi:hypothetical protein
MVELLFELHHRVYADDDDGDDVDKSYNQEQSYLIVTLNNQKTVGVVLQVY